MTLSPYLILREDAESQVVVAVEDMSVLLAVVEAVE